MTAKNCTFASIFLQAFLLPQQGWQSVGYKDVPKYLLDSKNIQVKDLSQECTLRMRELYTHGLCFLVPLKSKILSIFST